MVKVKPPINEDSISRPNVIHLLVSPRWAAGLFKTTFLHIYTRDRHGDDVPERLELRTVEQVRIETSERLLPLSGLGQGFLEGLMVRAIVSPTFLPNILLKTAWSLLTVQNHTFGSGSSLGSVEVSHVRFASGMGIPPELIEKVNQLQNIYDINWRMFLFDIFLKTILNSDQ